MKKRSYVFWYHYNKPASSKAGKPQVTVHYRGACHIVDNIVVDVPTFGHLKKDQPHFVIKGKTENFEIKNNIAYIS